MFRRSDIIGDPLGWTWLISLAFLGLCLIRLTIPETPNFDEIHYLPAARALLDGSEWLNREHPILGKELIALGIAIFGDTPFGWRIMPLLFGTLALFASMRALWFASLSRFASIAYGILLATGFFLFVQSRIAMLDIFMAAFFAVALWQCAAAIREPETGLKRLAIAGVAIGLAMASKWNVVFLAMMPGLAFFAARLTAGRRRLLSSKRGIPIPGISLLQAFVLLGLLPLFAYWLPHSWAYFIDQNPLQLGGFIAHHSSVLALQASVKNPHPYESVWYEWTLNIRSIWYMYEPIEGVQRGIMLLGNPLTILLGLPALAWCAWTGFIRRRWDMIALVALYLVSLGMWLVVNKPVQFFYHYFLPSCFLFGALALALDEFWQRGIRWVPLGVLGASSALFAFFFPLLSAAALEDEMSFMRWMWLDSWI